MPGAGEQVLDGMGELPVDPDLELDEARLSVLRQHARVIAAGGDPNRPLTPADAFRPPADLNRAQQLGIAAAIVFVLLSGLVSGRLADWFGVRGFALVLLAVAAAVAVGMRFPSRGSRSPFSWFDRITLLGTLVSAAITGSATALLLLPAIVHAAVARLIFASTREPMSLVEKGARRSHPLAPAFIGPYCRKLTVVWGSAFAASAALTTALAVGGYTEAHRTWTGWLFWTLLSGFCVAEFFWRKAWFRYFGQGPIDQLLSRIFPPQSTARGRKSQAYLLRMRAELVRLAEVERAAKRGEAADSARRQEAEAKLA